MASPRTKHLVRFERRPRAGFALLITITLLAFLVILLVGLAAYTRVETAVASNTQRQAQARQNALLALNVAVAQLQKHAGPDTRVTATSESFPNTSGTRHYTGVWRNDPPPDPDTDPLQVMTWLVSGNELPFDPKNPATTGPLAITPLSTLNTTNGVALVSTKTSLVANDVLARLMPITTRGVPGIPSTDLSPPTIGRYAWWIGDQGVKAPVAVADTSGSVAYPPYDSDVLRSRIRQQVSLGAGAADANGAPVFEPRATNNAALAINTTAFSQLAFFNKSNSGLVGLTTLQQNFHAWSPNNLNVLASTAPATAGLRRDLSIDPSILGADFANWIDYKTYMEDPANSAASAYPPTHPYDPNSPRRRYVMQDGSPRISPVLTFFLLSFNVRTLPTPAGNPSASPQPVQVRLRGAFTLWNPYSSALVPEDLQLEVKITDPITGGPISLRLDNVTTPANSALIPIASLFDPSSVLRFSLPWSLATAPTSTPIDDRSSWLPGRTYSWTINEDLTGNVPSGAGYLTTLNSQNISVVSGQGIQQLVPGLVVDGSDQCHLETQDQTTIQVSVVAPRSSGPVPLGSFISPVFDSFRTTTRDLGSFTYTPTFVFRLAESDNGPSAWLTTPGIDPRESPLPGTAYVVGTTGSVNGPRPELYENVVTISAPDRLLDRDVASFAYNEDTPVFELPRSPVLSLGALQHFPVAGQRPFAIGNPWGAQAVINGVPAVQLFDQFFFSGLTSGVTPTASGSALVLPNPLLKTVSRMPDGAAVSASDLQVAPNAQSSKYLLQGGSFNINSTNPLAWSAVLRSVRFPAPQSFSYLEADFGTGTAGDASVADIQPGDTQFFRLSQSAQETFRADPGYAASTVAPSILGPDVASAANTDLFRKGMKTLSAGVVRAMADKIVQLVQQKHRASGPEGGPFRTLEEFLAPSALFQDGNGTNRSLLEAAIADAATSGGASANGMVLEFSSQWLTQADVMTALAPVLFPRSDTFVVRAYGEALNPVTSTATVPVIEGRAWCEAVVQRVPEYFDPSVASGDTPEVAPAALVSLLNQTNGRRFKIISFRWLTRSDI